MTEKEQLLKEIEDVAADVAKFCYCESYTCHGCEENTKNLFKEGANFMLEKYLKLKEENERLKEAQRDWNTLCIRESQAAYILREQNKKLRDALEFYADHTNIRKDIYYKSDEWGYVTGKKAIETLAEIEGE